MAVNNEQIPLDLFPTIKIKTEENYEPLRQFIIRLLDRIVQLENTVINFETRITELEGP